MLDIVNNIEKQHKNFVSEKTKAKDARKSQKESFDNQIKN